MMAQIKVHGVVRDVFIELETIKYGRKIIIYRDVLPNGKLGKMYHSTNKDNLLENNT